MDLYQFKWWDSTNYRPIFPAVNATQQLPADLSVATQLTIVTNHSSVNSGSAVTLTATLTALGAGLVGYNILFDQQIGTVWTYMNTVITGASGIAALVINPTTTTTYRARFLGG